MGIVGVDVIDDECDDFDVIILLNLMIEYGDIDVVIGVEIVVVEG